jgi:hypothetical protein
MSALIPTSLVVAALLVLAYIVGSELCLPTVRHALHTGETEPWRLACRLVVAGEWAVIAVGACLLLTLEHVWHLFSATPAGSVLGLSAAGLIVAATGWELAGRSRRHFTRVMSTSLDLALPASGSRRELYERLLTEFETGSRAAQQRVLQALLTEPS